MSITWHFQTSRLRLRWASHLKLSRVKSYDVSFWHISVYTDCVNLRQITTQWHISGRKCIYSLAEATALLWLLHRHRLKNATWIWMHHLNTKRPDFCSFSHLFSHLINHPKKFYNIFRTNENFKKLVELASLSIREINSKCRHATEERVTILR